MIFKSQLLYLLFILILNTPVFAQADINSIIDSHYSHAEELYKVLHANPELSLQEKNTSKRIAEELHSLGVKVTENVGGYGVVGVFENGDGPVVLVRSDMDALPVKEETDVPFASNATAINVNGEETYVMHACGHDLHMAAMIGTARSLNELKDQWKGTIVFIAQPAEEIGLGAINMIDDGLFERFPRPDFALALHVNSAMESGKAGVVSGYAYANVDNLTIRVKGRGGHGAYPDLTVDPVVIASRLVLDLQTIISREISALDSAVLTVGSIRGGQSANIIPNEIELKITLRTFKDEVRDKIIRRIREMADAAGIAAGLPESEWPEIEFGDNPGLSVYNNPELAEVVSGTFKKVLGEENIEELSPVMYGEDFAMYGRVSPEIPAVLYSIGSVNPEVMRQYEQGLINAIPSTHSSKYLPDLGPSLRTGMLTMSSIVLELMSSDEN